MPVSEQLTTNVINVIDTFISDFVNKVATHYNIPKDELLNLWGAVEPSEKQSLVKSERKNSTLSTSNIPAELANMTKVELVELCKSKSLKVSGSKAELIGRLQESAKNQTRLVTSSNTSLKASSKSTPLVPALVTKLVDKLPTIEIKRNKFGNFEHSDTSLLFDKKSEKVIGRQLPDGQIAQLRENDIEACYKYKFDFIVPDNLNQCKNIKKSVLPADEEDFNEEDFEEVEEDVLEEDEILDEEEEILDEEEIEEEEVEVEFDEDYE